MLESVDCIVCGKRKSAGLAVWHRVCTACGYESAALAPAINQAHEHHFLDEEKREAALRSIRNASFKVIVARARKQLARARPRLLDVGCAHGWFLEQARADFEVMGVEPDEYVFKKTAAKGLPVRNGYFPDILSAEEEFDVIVFNDVIEHIPHIGAALDDVHARLHQDGILVLNLPSSTGLFYRLSKLFKRAGVEGPFNRMWQKGLPSPHVHYFSPANLQQLVHARGFEEIDAFELPSVRADGLWERISCVGTGSTAMAYVQYIAIRCAMPFLNLFKSDIVVCIFRKRAVP
ncbi:class I SAM-dependent methyltransferase [Massilia sp. DWR3-1-1]|uniref:class I SAM-dependent methyltransferase n=1 Tax=Massilia sp. DWR3-1-1 TaxID=2804559 RepID=UPI003CF7B157